MKAKWFVKNIKGDFSDIAAHFNITPITARLLVNRHLKSVGEINEYINADKSELTDPSLLIDLTKAVNIIKNKIDEKKKIRIIGDYDVDGVCSTFILLDGLKNAGGIVDYDIPDRVADGYGLNKRLVEKAISEKIDTIITCDNGIAAFEEIKFAKENGLTVILTDHHDIPTDGKIPPADTVTDPKIVGSEYPYNNICGAVVAFNLIRLYYKLFGINIDAENEYLPFAALATICDVMDLVDENRRIVKQGLPLIKKSENTGFIALLAATGLSAKTGLVSVYDCGFILGPCINACGRLENANIAMALFLAESMDEAKTIAEKMRDLNEERKADTEEGFNRASEIADSEEYLQDKVLVLYVKDCSESIVGIVAGRIKEKYNKPTIILTNAESGIKGSGRSIEAYNMFLELSKCKDLFSKFGGHPMAAGLSIVGDTLKEQEENLMELRTRLNANTTLTEEDLMPKIRFDMELPFKYVSEKLINEWNILEPFGTGNDKPMFAKRSVTLKSLRVLGKNRNAVKMNLCDGGEIIYEGIHFGPADDFLDELREKFGDGIIDTLLEQNGRIGDFANPLKMDIIYYPSINEYRDIRTIQFVIEYIR